MHLQKHLGHQSSRAAQRSQVQLVSPQTPHMISVLQDLSYCRLEEGILMVAVDKKDFHVLHFLWVNDVSKEEPELHVNRFTRVVFGISPSPFLFERHHIVPLRTTPRHSQEHSELLNSVHISWSCCVRSWLWRTSLSVVHCTKIELLWRRFNLLKF